MGTLLHGVQTSQSLKMVVEFLRSEIGNWRVDRGMMNRHVGASSNRSEASHEREKFHLVCIQHLSVQPIGVK